MLKYLRKYPEVLWNILKSVKCFEVYISEISWNTLSNPEVSWNILNLINCSRLTFIGVYYSSMIYHWLQNIPKHFVIIEGSNILGYFTYEIFCFSLEYSDVSEISWSNNSNIKYLEASRNILKSVKYLQVYESYLEIPLNILKYFGIL